jgi:hypothetical protein
MVQVSGMRGAYLGSRSFRISALRRNNLSATISCAKTRGQGTPFQALLTSRALIIGGGGLGGLTSGFRDC